MVLVSPRKGHTAIFLGDLTKSSKNKFKGVIGQIMRSELGNGKERINNLKKLGYTNKEIEQIQDEVNKILKG